MCDPAHRGYRHQINRLILSVCLAASCIATIVAVALIGAPGLVLLPLAGLITAVLLFDEELSHRLRHEGRHVADEHSQPPRAQIEADEDAPLGASDEQHEEPRSVDFPSDAPAYRVLRRREERRRTASGRAVPTGQVRER